MERPYQSQHMAHGALNSFDTLVVILKDMRPILH
jgi:hypothetical protein